MKDLIPTLKGFTSPNTDTALSIRVWCPYCQRFHTHGIPVNLHPSAKEHRVAHCTIPDSPFKKTGYYIKAFSKKDLQEMN